jgi:hypothetical protein
MNTYMADEGDAFQDFGTPCFQVIPKGTNQIGEGPGSYGSSAGIHASERPVRVVY